MNNNYCVIMSGGIGARFWPMSRVHMPKQFLDFFGTGRSLIQLTYDRFRKIIPAENIVIVTNEMYADLVCEQLPELKRDQILCEPQRRNTAPCIAWASYHIRTLNPNANIVVAPSDHLILKEEKFLEYIEKGLTFVSKNNKLLTLGISPSRPETGYGYIQTGDTVEEDLFNVKTFTEKPNLEMARLFVDSGEFLWNSGMFLWNVQTIVSAFEQLMPDMAARFESGSHLYGTEGEKAFIDEHFPACQSISIDYGVMEKSSNVDVLRAEFGWSDVGTWGSLYDISEKNESGNVALKGKLLDYDSQANVVSLPEGKLAVIQGLNGYIVSESDNVLMICRMEDEQHIRQFVADAQLKYGDDYV